MTDRSDADIVSWIPAGGPPRRIVFEPRSGDAAAYERVEEVYRHGAWEPVGREFVDEVAIERGTDC